jgi:hypothetical protein
LPDSISCNEGILPPGHFSRSLRKLATCDLLVESFFGRRRGFLNVEMNLNGLRVSSKAYHRLPSFPAWGSILLVLQALLLAKDWGRERGARAEKCKRTFIDEA